MRRPAILAVALLFATATVAQGGTVPRVTGDYAYAYGGGTTTISLDARATTPASGRFHFERDTAAPGQPYAPNFDGDVVCVFINGQDAWVIGVVTSGNLDLPAYFIARVHDSGLRGGVGDAAISFAGPGDPPPGCKMPLQWNLTAKLLVPISNGNILIH